MFSGVLYLFTHFVRVPLQQALIGLLVMMMLPLAAQESTENAGINESIALMERQQWAEALKALRALADRQDPQPNSADMGEMHYRKGLCEHKLGRFADAMKSFETCYMDFVPGKDGAGNRYHKLALLKWGDSALAAEQHELAMRQYQKFLSERDKEPYSRGSFHINVSICCFKLGKIAEGVENLEIAMKNKDAFPTPLAGIIAGLQAFVGAAIAKNDEQSLLDFVNKNRADLQGEPFEMQEYHRLILQLAQDAVSKGMLRAGIMLHQMIADSGVVLDDAKARLAALGGLGMIEDRGHLLLADNLKKSIEQLTAENGETSKLEIAQLRAIAGIHESHGNARGAMAAYECLELYHAKTAQREAHLFELIRSSAVAGEMANVEKYALVFETVFANSAQLAAVRETTLTSLYREGFYQKCVEMSEKWFDTIDQASKLYDICLHVLGGSYYHLGLNSKAQPLLDRHVAAFPQSPRHPEALYLQASNLTRLQDFEKAAVLLDEYLKRFSGEKSNHFLPVVMMDRSTCFFAERDYQRALEMLDQLANEFPNAAVLDLASNMKGNVLMAMGERQQAEDCYKTAFARAEKNGRKIVAGESVFLLVSLLGELGHPGAANPRLKDALTWIDKFWKDYAATSQFRTQVAIAGVATLVEAGRGEEGMNRLNEVIIALAADPTSPHLQKAIMRYAEIYLTKKTLADLRQHFYAFPGLPDQAAATRALLRIALIEVHEDAALQAKTEQGRNGAWATIRSLYNELKADFLPKDLSPFVLIAVGDHIREKTSAPREALQYYAELLTRADSGYSWEAQYGQADVFGRSKLPEEVEKGISDLQEVFQKSPDALLQEKALRRKIELLAVKGDWQQVSENATQYLNKYGENAHSVVDGVRLLLAQSHEKSNKSSEAIPIYAALAFRDPLNEVGYSAIACRKWMQLLWERDAASVDDKPSDRQAAYNGGFRYLDGSRARLPLMSESEKESWNAVAELVKDFEAFPGIVAQKARNTEPDTDE